MQVGTTAVRAIPLTRLAAPTASAASPAVCGSRTLDISKIPFRVAFEVVGINQGQLDRQLAKFRWNATTTGDCSHGQNQYSGTYIRIDSPDLYLNDKTWEQVGEVMKTVRGLGAKIGDTSAMKICVSNRNLDLETKKEIFRIHQAAEPILYRLSQNGNSFHVGHNTHNYMPHGWSLEPGNKKGNYYFCMPPSQNPKASEVFGATSDYALDAAIKGTDRYQGKHQGYQPNSQGYHGYAEFRYFTATLDAAVVRADAETVLGLVKAAHEKRWPKDAQPQAVSQSAVNWSTYHAFLGECLGDSPSRAVVEKLFGQAGGKVTAPPVSPQDRERLQKLQQQGYQITLAQSSRAVDLEKAVGSDLTVSVQEPGQNAAYSVPGKHVLAYLKLANGEEAVAAPFDAAVLTQSRQLRQAGVGFFFRGGDQPLQLPVGAAAVLNAGSLEAEVAGTRYALPHKNAFGRLAFQVLGATFSEEQRAVTAVAMELADRGYAFTAKGDDGKLTTPMEVAQAAANERLQVTLPSSLDTWELKGPQAAQFLAAEAGHEDKLSPEVRNRVLLAAEMTRAGYMFSHADGKSLQAKLGVPMALAEGKLCYKLPHSATVTRFSGDVARGDFDRWALASLGRKSELDQDTRDMLEGLEKLQTQGVMVRASVDNSPGGGSILNSLDTARPVQVQISGGQARALHSQADLAAWVKERKALPQSLNAEQQRALERLQQLQDSGAALIVSQRDRAAIRSPQHAAWLLVDQQPLAVADRAAPQAQMIIPDLAALEKTMAVELGAPQEVPAAERQLLEDLSKLQQHHVKFYSNGAPLSLKSLQIEALRGNSLQASLPKRIWWKCLPRKNITVTSSADLQRANRKLEAKA